MKTIIATLLLWCTTFCSAQSVAVITTFRQVPAAAASSGLRTFVQECDSTSWTGDTGPSATCTILSAAAGDVLADWRALSPKILGDGQRHRHPNPPRLG